MRPDTRTTTVFSIILVLALAACVLTLRPIDRMRAGTSLEEVLYIPSADVIRRLSLGYSGLAADIYWTRAVQYFGNHHHIRAARYDLLYPLLDITSRLDPQLLEVYQFGSIFLSQRPPAGAGLPDKAAELVERGIEANPNEWKLYYNLGFIYFDQKDYLSAQKVFERGSNVPNANPAMGVLAASMAQKSGDRDTARLLWTKLYESSGNKDLRANALNRLMALKVQDEMAQLERLLDNFRERTGRSPTNFEEMVASGWLRSVPKDPTGVPYKLQPNGTIELQNIELLPYIETGPKPSN